MYRGRKAVTPEYIVLRLDRKMAIPDCKAVLRVWSGSTVVAAAECRM